jgi:hypothetical protein
MELAQDYVQWPTLVLPVFNLRVLLSESLLSLMELKAVKKSQRGD